jgi:hypothetical protein
MAKSALSFIPETDEEAREANRAYQEALARLTQTLEARKNPTFDPVMMAMAAGFLGPTRTGSFGEALGRAAEGVGKAQSAESAQDVEIAKQQMELAQSGLGMQRMRQQSREIADFLSPQGGTTLTPGRGLPGGEEGAPRGGLGGIPIMQPDPNFISIQEFVARNQGRGKSLGELELEYQEKFGKNRYLTTERNVVDRATGTVAPLPGGPNVTRQIVGLPGTYEMDSYTASMLDNYRRNGMMEQYYDLASKITGREDIKPKVKESGPAGAPTGAPPESEIASPKEPTPPKKDKKPPDVRSAFGAEPIRSKEQIEAEAAGATESAKARAKSLEGQRDEAMDRGGRTATSSIQVADLLTSFASMPDAKEMFGLASQGNLLPNFVNLLSAGISVPGGGIGISGLEDFYRNAKLKPEQLERYRTALQQMRTMNIMMSQYAKGSVSNYEQGLFGEASINEKDLPGTILLKSEALRARAQFDKSVAELLRKNDKLTVESVKDLPAYQQAEARLNERYRNLILKKPEFFKDPTFVDAAKRNDPNLIGSMDRVPSSSGARPNTPLTDQLRQRSQSRGF